MKYNFHQKEKDDLDLLKIMRGNTSSYNKNHIYNNMQKDINKYNFQSSRYKRIIINNIFSNREIDNNALSKNVNNLKNNLSLPKDNNNNNNYKIYPPNLFNSYEYKSSRNHRLNDLEKIINKNIIENKVKTPNIQENLINQRYKNQSENTNRNNFKFIDGKILDKNFQEEGDIDYYQKKKLYLVDKDKKMKELITTSFQEIKEKLVIKEKNIIELNNKIKEYEKDKQNYENKIELLNEKIDEINRREKETKKEMEELQKKGNIEIEQIKSKLNKYIDENNQIKHDNKILSLKNKELEEEIKEIKSKYQSQERINNEEIITVCKNPILKGLNSEYNIFNSILLCLSHTAELTSYFLNNKNIEQIANDNIESNDKNDKKLSTSYLKLIQNLCNINETEAYSTDTFMNTIKNINPLFEIENENNLKEFIIFIIEQLHKELKKKNPKIKDCNSKINETLDQYDRNKTFNYCYNKFKEESSIISDLFFGLKETSNECLNCRNNYNSRGLPNNSICYNYEMFHCLIFPLEEIKNIKNNYMRNNNIQTNNNYITLNDCFSYNQRLEYYTGDNKNYCNVCKQLSDSCYNSKIFFSPKIMILIMKRDQENEYNLNFEEKLDITEFVYSKDLPMLKYDLYGVISDIRKEDNIYFVSSCKNPVDNKWYRYDDKEVTSISNVEKDVIQYGNPYILFYKKS